MLVLLPASALAQTLTATNFVKYFDYDGSTTVTGMVVVTTDGTTQTLDWSLTGHESYCSLHVKGSEDNSCGIHIHSGTTCASDAGSHYYDEGTITDDPWATVAYGEYEPGTVGSHSGTASVDTGLSSSALEGRALIYAKTDSQANASANNTADAAPDADRYYRWYGGGGRVRGPGRGPG
jgi:Cu/Zn superoxide dismutase